MYLNKFFQTVKILVSSVFVCVPAYWIRNNWMTIIKHWASKQNHCKLTGIYLFCFINCAHAIRLMLTYVRVSITCLFCFDRKIFTKVTICYHHPHPQQELIIYDKKLRLNCGLSLYHISWAHEHSRLHFAVTVLETCFNHNWKHWAYNGNEYLRIHDGPVYR